MLIAAAAYAWLGPEEGVMAIGWPTVLAIGLLCGLGELVEFVAGMWGAHRAGGSRRAAVFSLIGSLIGAIAGGVLGLPLAVIGSPLGAILGGALGALLGAGIAEYSLGESEEKQWKVGQAAFWGRLLGTGFKSLIATIIVILTMVALIF